MSILLILVSYTTVFAKFSKFHESNKPRKQVEFANGSKRDRLPRRSAVYIDNQMKKDIHSVIYGAFKNA